MDNASVKLPAYLKIAQIFIGISVFFYILYIGQDIIIPLVFAIMIAILLNPVIFILCRFEIPRVIAILLSLLVTMLLIAAIFYFFITQISLFSESAPQFKEKFIALFSDFERWISHTFNVSKWKVDAWVTKTQKQGMDNGTVVITQTISTIGGMFITFVIMPVYVFMIIYYKPLLLEFIARLFPKNVHVMVVEVFTETRGLIQSYLFGLLVEALLVAALNSIALWILGIEYAILLGVIGALLNVIPYIGGVVAVALPGPLQPFGFLLGDNQPDITREIFVVRRRSRAAAK
jgi:predicted PurR-regulated permease PerM